MRIEAMVSVRVACLAVAMVLVPAPEAMGAASFHHVGGLPGAQPAGGLRDVSADGKVAVGGSLGADGRERAVYWTERDGLVPIGGGGMSMARGVSADGSVIVGSDGDRAFRWTKDGGMTYLFPLGGEALAVSADGSVVAASNGGAYRWTAAGAERLGDNTFPWDISLDGSTIVGTVSDTPQRLAAVRWTGQGMQRLGDLYGGNGLSVPFAVSGDGSVVAGSSYVLGTPAKAFVWRDGVGMSELPGVPAGLSFSPRAMSADGSVMVGDAGNATGSWAALWDAAHGMRLLHDVLGRDNGIDLAGWTLYAATGVSADGTTIAGSATNPAGPNEGFVAVVPEPAAGAATVVLGSMLLRRRRREPRGGARSVGSYL